MRERAGHGAPKGHNVQQGIPRTAYGVRPVHAQLLALQAMAGNRAVAQRFGSPVVQRESGGSPVVQREGGDGEETAETWTEWAYRNRWKIGGGVVAVAALSGLAYYLYQSNKVPDVKMSQVGSSTATTGSEVTSSGVSSASTGATDALTQGGASETIGGGGSEAISQVVSGGPGATEGAQNAIRHAWELGQTYTVLDKLKGLIGLVPGGGAAVKAVETYIDPSGPNQEKLVAELAKLALGPMGVVPNTWDSVSEILSYYSSGRIEIGQTIDLIRKAGEGMASMEKDFGPGASILLGSG